MIHLPYNNSREYISKDLERQLAKEFKEGATVEELKNRYCYKTDKSILDKVKRYYPEEYEELLEEHKLKRKGYNYRIPVIRSEFDAYFVGLVITDGYIAGRKTDIGIDLTDEDAIAFLAKSVNKDYKTYNYHSNQDYLPRHRLILSGSGLIEDMERFGLKPNKSKTIRGPKLYPEEEKFLPYLIRGIIDGNGTVTMTSYGKPLFKICTASYEFAVWLKSVLENKLYMEDIGIGKSKDGNGIIYNVGSAKIKNIYILRAIVYDKPFGMARKFNHFNEMFRDCYGSILEKDNGTVQTTNI